MYSSLDTAVTILGQAGTLDKKVNSFYEKGDRGSAEGGSKSVELGREADNGHSLARLEPMDQVGGKADTCGGLSTDTAFLFGDGAEGVVAVEPEAVFPGWRPARRECLPGGTQ